MNIRNAVENEFVALREERVSAYSEYAQVVPNEHWNALKQAISSTADTQPGVELIIADIDGRIAGSVALFPANTDAYEGYTDALDYPEIRMLAVSPQYRGTGVGRALVQECFRRTRAKGFRYIGLHTGEFMQGAIKLYEKMGFKRIPAYDFQPADDGITVRAYRCDVE